MDSQTNPYGASGSAHSPVRAGLWLLTADPDPDHDPPGLTHAPGLVWTATESGYDASQTNPYGGYVFICVHLRYLWFKNFDIPASPC